MRRLLAVAPLLLVSSVAVADAPPTPPTTGASPLPAVLVSTYKALAIPAAAEAAKCAHTGWRSNECAAKAYNDYVVGADGKPVDYSLFGKNDAHWYKRDLKSITKVVIHNGGYSAKMNTDTWLSEQFIASHYTIEESGHIVQHAGEEMIAGHAKSFNNEAIGIELNIRKVPGTHVSCNSVDGERSFPALHPSKPHDRELVKAACAPTAAQYESLRRLVHAISLRTSVTWTPTSLVGHCEGHKDDHGDPRAFDWSQLGIPNAAKPAGRCRWYGMYP